MTNKTRVNRVTTRSGDGGESGLADGSRFAKHHPLFVAMGELDELSAAIGVLRTHELPADVQALLAELQQRLFDLGAELALPGEIRIRAAAVSQLETRITGLNETLPPLTEFVLPGGTAAAAWVHYVRTLARRAERALVQVHQEQPRNAHSLAFLNRLSDYFFVLARWLNIRANHPETLWDNSREH